MDVKNIYEDAILFSGTVKLAIASPVSESQIHSFEKSIHDSQELHLEVISGSSTEGTTFVVSMSQQKPMWLLDTLRAIPSVKQAIIKNNQIVVTLQSLTLNKE